MHVLRGDTNDHRKENQLSHESRCELNGTGSKYCSTGLRYEGRGEIVVDTPVREDKKVSKLSGYSTDNKTEPCHNYKSSWLSGYNANYKSSQSERREYGKLDSSWETINDNPGQHQKKGLDMFGSDVGKNDERNLSSLGGFQSNHYYNNRNALDNIRDENSNNLSPSSLKMHPRSAHLPLPYYKSEELNKGHYMTKCSTKILRAWREEVLKFGDDSSTLAMYLTQHALFSLEPSQLNILNESMSSLNMDCNRNCLEPDLAIGDGSLQQKPKFRKRGLQQRCLDVNLCLLPYTLRQSVGVNDIGCKSSECEKEKVVLDLVVRLIEDGMGLARSHFEKIVNERRSHDDKAVEDGHMLNSGTGEENVLDNEDEEGYGVFTRRRKGELARKSIYNKYFL